MERSWRGSRVDQVVAGDTRGGQIVLPGIGPCRAPPLRAGGSTV
jgi:predicted MPP superfamily phosphohydrolase